MWWIWFWSNPRLKCWNQRKRKCWNQTKQQDPWFISLASFGTIGTYSKPRPSTSPSRLVRLELLPMSQLVVLAGSPKKRCQWPWDGDFIPILWGFCDGLSMIFHQLIFLDQVFCWSRSPNKVNVTSGPESFDPATSFLCRGLHGADEWLALKEPLSPAAIIAHPQLPQEQIARRVAELSAAKGLNPQEAMGWSGSCQHTRFWYVGLLVLGFKTWNRLMSGVSCCWIFSFQDANCTVFFRSQVGQAVQQAVVDRQAVGGAHWTVRYCPCIFSPLKKVKHDPKVFQEVEKGYKLYKTQKDPKELQRREKLLIWHKPSMQDNNCRPGSVVDRSEASQIVQVLMLCSFVVPPKTSRTIQNLKWHQKRAAVWAKQSKHKKHPQLQHQVAPTYLNIKIYQSTVEVLELDASSRLWMPPASVAVAPWFRLVLWVHKSDELRRHGSTGEDCRLGDAGCSVMHVILRVYFSIYCWHAMGTFCQTNASKHVCSWVRCLDSYIIGTSTHGTLGGLPGGKTNSSRSKPRNNQLLGWFCDN